jgi:superfamily II DNA/RNA helicase
VVTDTEEYARANKSGGTPVPKTINHKKRFVTSLHGDLPQTARDAAIASLRAGECDVLVATDVAARGLDLPGVELVVHADLPKDADAYAHRAGRAGRVGCLKKGVSLVLSATGSAAAEATSALEAGAKIRLRRLSCIGERVVTERSVAAVQAAWEAAAGRTNLTEGGESFESQSKPRDSKNAVALTEASLARLGERSLMNDRFDELSVDLASIRGKQKGGNAGKGRGQGKR